MFISHSLADFMKRSHLVILVPPPQRLPSTPAKARKVPSMRWYYHHRLLYLAGNSLGASGWARVGYLISGGWSVITTINQSVFHLCALRALRSSEVEEQGRHVVIVEEGRNRSWLEPPERDAENVRERKGARLRWSKLVPRFRSRDSFEIGIVNLPVN